jgi:hypothetical protein
MFGADARDDSEDTHGRLLVLFGQPRFFGRPGQAPLMRVKDRDRRLRGRKKRLARSLGAPPGVHEGHTVRPLMLPRRTAGETRA